VCRRGGSSPFDYAIRSGCIKSRACGGDRGVDVKLRIRCASGDGFGSGKRVVGTEKDCSSSVPRSWIEAVASLAHKFPLAQTRRPD